MCVRGNKNTSYILLLLKLKTISLKHWQFIKLGDSIFILKKLFYKCSFLLDTWACAYFIPINFRSLIHLFIILAFRIRNGDHTVLHKILNTYLSHDIYCIVFQPMEYFTRYLINEIVVTVYPSNNRFVKKRTTFEETVKIAPTYFSKIAIILKQQNSFVYDVLRTCAKCLHNIILLLQSQHIGRMWIKTT